MKRLIMAAAMIAASVMLSACSINFGGRVAGMNRVEENTEKSVKGGNIKTIEVVSPVGSVKINTWDKYEIQVVATKVNNGLKSKSELLDELKNAEIIYKEESERFTIKAYLPKFKNNGMSVQFEIYVPQNIKVYNVDAEVGDVRIDGAQGEIEIVNNVGKIDVSNSTGVMNLKAVTGDVTVRKSNLKPNSSIVSNVGRVLFEGTIDAKGTYKMTTNVGKVDVSLPSGTAFDIDASTNVGNVDCEFEVSGTKDNRKVKGSVNGGGPSVNIVNNTGSVSINKR